MVKLIISKSGEMLHPNVAKATGEELRMPRWSNYNMIPPKSDTM